MEKLHNYKGLIFGLIVGIAWGLNTVLIGQIATTSKTLADGTAASSLLISFLHDSFCLIWLILIMSFLGKFKSSLHLLKTKKGRAVCLAALVGAPVGMSGFVLAINYASPAYASAISVIYPGVGAIMAYFFLQERISFKAAMGIALSIIGAISLGYSNPDLAGYPQFYLGIAFAGLAVVGWASEGVILAYAMKKIKDEEHIIAKPEEFLTLRYLTSTLVYGLVVIPFVGGYNMLVELEPSVFASFAGIAILGVITYLSWYKAVHYVGAAMGTALNSTASFWALIFSYLILGKQITLYLAICSALIIAGVFIFSLSNLGDHKLKRKLNRTHIQDI